MDIHGLDPMSANVGENDLARRKRSVGSEIYSSTTSKAVIQLAGNRIISYARYDRSGSIRADMVNVHGVFADVI